MPGVQVAFHGVLSNTDRFSVSDVLSGRAVLEVVTVISYEDVAGWWSTSKYRFETRDLFERKAKNFTSESSFAD
jgi:hypothetical protein